VLVLGKKIAPQNPFAPILVMLLAGCGGAVWRYVERRERGLQPQAEWLNRSGVVHRILVYGTMYGFLRERQGIEFARLFLVAVHTLKEMYEGKNHCMPLARRDKTRQDKTRQDKTRQGKKRQD
jgi:hypothetical protein